MKDQKVTFRFNLKDYVTSMQTAAEDIQDAWWGAAFLSEALLLGVQFHQVLGDPVVDFVLRVDCGNFDSNEALKNYTCGLVLRIKDQLGIPGMVIKSEVVTDS